MLFGANSKRQGGNLYFWMKMRMEEALELRHCMLLRVAHYARVAVSYTHMHTQPIPLTKRNDTCRRSFKCYRMTPCCVQARPICGLMSFAHKRATSMVCWTMPCEMYPKPWRQPQHSQWNRRPWWDGRGGPRPIVMLPCNMWKRLNMPCDNGLCVTLPVVPRP